MRYWGNYVRYRTKEAFVVAAVFFSSACLLQMFHVPPLPSNETNGQSHSRIKIRSIDDDVTNDDVILKFEKPVNVADPKPTPVKVRGLQNLPKEFKVDLKEERALFKYCIEPDRVVGTNGLLNARRFQGHTWSGPYMSGAVVYLVASKIQHIDRRSLLRETWGSIRDLEGRKIELVFIIGTNNGRQSGIMTSDIATENSVHNDILQFAGDDNSATNVRLAALQWAGNSLPGDFYVALTDDDVIVNLPYVMDYVTAESPPVVPPASVIMTSIEGGGSIVSSQSQRMFCLDGYEESELTKRDGHDSVNMSVYSSMKYPPYCPGELVVMPVSLAQDISNVARVTQPTLPHQLHQVFITGILRRKLNRGDDNIVAAGRQGGYCIKYHPSKVTDAKILWQSWYDGMRHRHHIYSISAIR
nr:uncharacterized protein LOC100179189 [Ciona intestinalis]|eukprot:XP_002122218.1 uncharacterized protein LOC100179189 [Ciona intestinalis]